MVKAIEKSSRVAPVAEPRASRSVSGPSKLMLWMMAGRETMPQSRKRQERK
jgi:hypothetical protein